MPVEMAQVVGLSPASTGLADYTVAGFGDPTAAIFFFGSTGQVVNPSAHFSMSVGFTDGVRQSLNTARIPNNGPNTSTRLGINNAVAGYIGQEVIERAIFDSFITDGVRLNWTNRAYSPWYVVVVLIKGTTNVHANFKQLMTLTNSITDPGFKPDLVFVSGVGYPSQALVPHCIFSFGAAHNNSSDVVTQAWFGIDQPQQGTSLINAILRTDACTGQTFSGSESWRGAAQNFNANGFDIVTNHDAGDDYIFYLALELENPDDADISIIDTPITTGPQSYSNPGFEPNFLFLFQTFLASTNVLTNASQGFVFGSADATEQAAIGGSGENGGSAGSIGNFSGTAIAELYGDPASKDIEATLLGFMPTGYQLNYTNIDATPRKWLQVAMKSDAAPPVVGENSIMFGTNF